MIKIFVSHSWADKEQPQFGDMYQQLKGFDLWVDKAGLTPGKAVRATLKKAIENAEIVLVFWSKNAASSPDVQFELKSATELNKPILPCIIDDYPISNSKYLKDLLYINLNEKNRALGWMRIRYYLADFFINRQAARIEKYDDEENKKQATFLLEDLKQSQKNLKLQIDRMQDTMHRISINAQNRNQNNPYILNMADALIDSIDQNNAPLQEQQLAEVMKYIKEVFTQYPNDDKESDKCRQELLLNKIAAIDPAGKNEKLILFKEMVINPVKV